MSCYVCYKPTEKLCTVCQGMRLCSERCFYIAADLEHQEFHRELEKDIAEDSSTEEIEKFKRAFLRHNDRLTKKAIKSYSRRKK